MDDGRLVILESGLVTTSELLPSVGIEVHEMAAVEGYIGFVGGDQTLYVMSLETSAIRPSHVNRMEYCADPAGAERAEIVSAGEFFFATFGCGLAAGHDPAGGAVEEWGPPGNTSLAVSEHDEQAYAGLATGDVNLLRIGSGSVAHSKLPSGISELAVTEHLVASEDEIFVVDQDLRCSLDGTADIVLARGRETFLLTTSTNGHLSVFSAL